MRIIAGRWKGRRLKPPRGKEIRPTTDRVREAWFSSLGDRVVGASVVDLFAGSGALGLEALSRGAASVVFVERSEGSLRVLRANIEALGAGADCRVIADDVFRALAAGPRDFDIALADPPYGTDAAPGLIRVFLRHPFANELWLEHSSREQLELPPEARTRRYGDTALTTIFRP